METEVKRYYALLVKPQATKTFKIILERSKLLDYGTKIHPYQQQSLFKEPRMVLSLIVEAQCESHEPVDVVLDDNAKRLFFDAHFRSCDDERARDVDVIIKTARNMSSVDITHNLLRRALAVSVQLIESFIPSSDSTVLQELVSALPDLYVIYDPMLLLPVNASSTNTWERILTLLHCERDLEPRFLQTLASYMRVTRIAINAPVPAATRIAGKGAVDNDIRSPTHLQPLYGDFGANLPPYPKHVPSSCDFEEAFWVSTRQNGITQTWAPRYTMFSGGNVTEKARILHLPSVEEAVSRGNVEGMGCSAVDLFSGIGYFAFSYAKAGVSKVLCWDLNPWSLEGLRRGATANKWSCSTLADALSDLSHAGECITSGEIAKAIESPNTFLLFCESNEHARERIATMSSLPPIRHVNCGMLPSAGAAWKTAVDVMDPRLGGWMHLHESLNEKNATRCANGYVAMVQDYFNTFVTRESTLETVRLEDTTRVKSMGPRLWHHVLDIWVPPKAQGPP